MKMMQENSGDDISLHSSDLDEMYIDGPKESMIPS
jgi:hypothetical protein